FGPSVSGMVRVAGFALAHGGSMYLGAGTALNVASAGERYAVVSQSNTGELASNPALALWLDGEVGYELRTSGWFFVRFALGAQALVNTAAFTATSSCPGRFGSPCAAGFASHEGSWLALPYGRFVVGATF